LITSHYKALLFCALTLTVSSVYAQKSGYTVLKTFHIPSEGRWDYVVINPVTGNLYVPHTKQVNVLNKNTGDSVGVIPNTLGVHGVAFAVPNGKGYTSNGETNDITVFDIKTNKVSQQIKGGERPDAIMYDDYSKKVYVCNGKSKDLSIIDPATDKVTASIALGGKPETAVSDNAGKLYINIEDKNEIVVVDVKTQKVTDHWTLGKGDAPTGLAIDLKTKRLFAGCSDNKMLVVMNATNGKIIENIEIGAGCDGVAFDPELKYIFASCGEGILSIIKEQSADKYQKVEDLPTLAGARTLTVDEKTHWVYMPTAEFEKPTGENVAGEKPKRPKMLPGSFQILVVGKK